MCHNRDIPAPSGQNANNAGCGAKGATTVLTAMNRNREQAAPEE
jgi:hypothetical protein